MQKRPLFITITIAAKIIDRSLRSRKGGVVKGHTCREGQIEQVTWCWPTRYSMPCMSYSWSTSEEDPDPCLSCDPDPGSKPCIPESGSCLLLSPVQDFLVSALQPLAWCQPPHGAQVWEIKYWLCIFCIIALITSIISKAVLIYNL